MEGDEEDAKVLKRLEYARERAKIYYSKNREQHSQKTLLRFYRNKVGDDIVNYFIDEYGYDIGLLKIKIYIKEQHLSRLVQENM